MAKSKIKSAAVSETTTAVALTGDASNTAVAIYEPGELQSLSEKAPFLTGIPVDYLVEVVTEVGDADALLGTNLVNILRSFAPVEESEKADLTSNSNMNAELEELMAMMDPDGAKEDTKPKPRAEYDQIDDVGRDQGLTFQALQALRVVIERYPDSEYARSAILKFDLAFDHLAGKEMEIGRYYLKHKHYTAAVNRFRVVVEQFQTTRHTPEALHRLVESYLSLGFVEEAQTAAAILGHNYQSTEWYQDSYKLLTGQGLEPKVFENNWLGAVYRQMIRGEWL